MPTKRTRKKPAAKPKPAPKPVNNVTPLPPRHLTVEAVAEAVVKFSGNLAAVGRFFTVTRTAVWLFIDRHPELKESLRDARETRIDNAESSLDRAILAGEGWAVTLLLKTQGKDRGYVERQEIALEEPVKLNIVKKVVRAGSDAGDRTPPGAV